MATIAKSRTWVIQSKLDAKRKGVVYETTLSRSYDAAMTVLGGFQGTLFTDGYQVYQMLDGVQHVNCWVHVRRSFTTIMTSHETARQFVHLIDQLFVIEQGLTKATAERRMAVRLEKSKPIVDKFWQLITTTHALPKSQLRRAIAYASKLHDNLNRFLYDGDIALSDNIAERSIRPITLDRKNWYFSTSEAGTQANDIMNSIVQSARANDLNVKKYLLYLLETVTTIGKWGRTERLEAYLPWHTEIIEQFKQS